MCQKSIGEIYELERTYRYWPRSPYRQTHHQRYTLAVEFIIDLLAHDWTDLEILRNCPDLTHEDIQACLGYASDLLRTEWVYPIEISQEVVWCACWQMKTFLWVRWGSPNLWTRRPVDKRKIAGYHWYRSYGTGPEGKTYSCYFRQRLRRAGFFHKETPQRVE